MRSSGIICIFSEDIELLYEQKARLDDRGYLVFSTSNIYKFVRYAQELQPDVMIVDMDAKAMQDDRVLAYLDKYRTNNHRPVLMIGKRFDRCYQGVAHYELKPYTSAELDEIIDSYCQGNQAHDVLLIDDCVSKDDKIRQAILEQNLSCFEVSDATAARYYLMKNNPRCICLNMPYDKCTKVEPQLTHNKIFFVDNYKQVKNLARLL